MSELIDRIFDVEKISGEVKDIISNLNSLNSTLDTLKSNVKDIADTTRKAKVGEDLVKNSKSLNDEFTKGGQVMKAWEIEVQKLSDKTKQLTDTEKQANIEIAKARLELQAAQKATKEAAIAEIELTAKNKDLSGSYNALQKDLTNSIKAYKALSSEEANSAKGKELLTKIGETQTALKKSDAAMGNYQRNVGNYSSALEGLTPKLGGLAGKLLDIAQAAKKSRDELNEAGGDNGLGIMANPRIPAGLATIMTGFKGIGQSVIAMGRAVLANPILAIGAAIVGIFALLKSAIDSNGQATEKLGQVMAPFKMLLAAVMEVVGKLVSNILDGVLAFGSFLNAVMSFIPGLDKLAEKNKEAIALEKEKQRLLRAGIVDKAADAKEELRLAELRKKIMEKDKYSAEERLAMAKDIDKSEKEMARDDADRANRNLISFLRDMKLKGKVQKDYTIEELQQLTDLQTAKYKEQQTYFDKTKKLASRASALQAEIAADDKAKAAEEKSNMDKIIAARRRLVDSEFALMKDSEAKQLKVSTETFNRQLQDLQRNGELTKALKSNMEKEQQIEIAKIKNDWNVKRMNDDIKDDELTLDNMKRAGKDTLQFEKDLLKEKMRLEVLAGGNNVEISKKYAFLIKDLEAKNADDKIALFEKEITKQSEILTRGYKERELIIKKDFSKSKQTAKDKAKYEQDLAQLQLDALLEVNNAQIAALQKELLIANIAPDKKTELSNKLKDLQIANENAVTDATIKANDDRVASDKLAIEKRIAVANALGEAAKEIFSGIADLQKQQSEQRIADLEKEQTLSDDKFSNDQANLDKSLMSDENRAQKQKELTEKKAASDKAIADKIKDEKIKQAKWDRANGIVQAIISAGLAILNAAQTKPFIPLGLIAAGLAATTGAIQIASIVSTQIPAYEKGTDNHPGGLSLWGEKRSEVAVFPSGDTFLATKPTLTNFDAGTKIYDSVQAYENAMGKQAIQQMAFDYDKFRDAMPDIDINWDAKGLLQIVNNQNSRRTLINRRYKR